MKPIVAILINKKIKEQVLNDRQMNKLNEIAEVRYMEIEKMDLKTTKELLSGADACITCWGSLPFNKEILDEAKNLKLIAHSAGSVKSLVCEEIWTRGIKVTSAAAANAVSVAEHTLGMMIAMLKRSFWLNNIIHKGGWNDNEYRMACRGMYDINIGIIGAGHIGRHLIKLLKAFHVDILLYDPYVSEREAGEMGVTKVSDLNELISISDILSLHAPNIPETRHMLNSDNLKLVKDNAVLINTARGALIDEKALYEEMKTGRFVACLDVTAPEPIEKNNPLLTLPNVIFTPHVAGALRNDSARMGEYAAREIEHFFYGKPLVYEVKESELSKMA